VTAYDAALGHAGPESRRAGELVAWTDLPSVEELV
jgi:hypothetical protein